MGSFQPNLGLLKMLYCAISMLTPAGRVTPLLRRMSLTTRRLRELAATGCSRMLSCRSKSRNTSEFFLHLAALNLGDLWSALPAAYIYRQARPEIAPQSFTVTSKTWHRALANRYVVFQLPRCPGPILLRQEVC